MKVLWIPEDEEIEEETDKHKYYFVDKPNTPIFLPIPCGVDKESQIFDSELFDYQQEVEPILQILVEKTLEAAKMELIEEFEKDIYIKHNKDFETRKEAELIELQRKENAQERIWKEIKRRKLQDKTFREQSQRTQQKLIARIISKELLSGMQQESLQILLDRGFLRDTSDTTIQIHYRPLLFKKINSNLHIFKTRESIIENSIMLVIEKLMNLHKNSITKEKEKRDKKRYENLQILQAIEEEKERKKIERETKKEMARKELIKGKINNLILSKAIFGDISEISNLKIVDMISKGSEKVLFIPGSAFLPIILALSGIFFKAREKNPQFIFPADTLLKIITSFLSDFPADYEILLTPGTLIPDRRDNNKENANLMIGAISYKNVESLGLAYLLRKSANNKMGLSKEVAEGFLLEFIKLFYQAPIPIIQERILNEEELKDKTPEENQKIKEEIAQENIEIKAKNEEIEKENSLLREKQSKMNIKVLEEPNIKDDICSIVQINTTTNDSKESIPFIVSKSDDITVAAIHMDLLIPILHIIIKKLKAILLSEELESIFSDEYELIMQECFQKFIVKLLSSYYKKLNYHGKEIVQVIYPEPEKLETEKSNPERSEEQKNE